jgi:isoaspartyl peptidase/L-asparaginase-like protein (Ntn-hydrolase superfamily)
MKPLIVVHGGATVFQEKYHSSVDDAIRAAAARGYCAMDVGGSALDAVEAAIWQLEETDLFTAGRGACQNFNGEIEVDAIMMDGSRLQSGAVMAVKDIIHPISLARYVLERTQVMQVVGQGANQLYKQMIDEGYRKELAPNRTEGPKIAEGCDTVGCVALDSSGRLASGSSTSGWPGKLPGRVGDSPIIGAGVYANEVAAVSCTGKGEEILRVVMAREAVSHRERGLSAQDACDRAMQTLREKTSGGAGLIMVDSLGRCGAAFDTRHMPIAIATDGKVIYSSVQPADVRDVLQHPGA